MHLFRTLQSRFQQGPYILVHIFLPADLLIHIIFTESSVFLADLPACEPRAEPAENPKQEQQPPHPYIPMPVMIQFMAEDHPQFFLFHGFRPQIQPGAEKSADGRRQPLSPADRNPPPDPHGFAKLPEDPDLSLIFQNDHALYRALPV